MWTAYHYNNEKHIYLDQTECQSKNKSDYQTILNYSRIYQVVRGNS